MASHWPPGSGLTFGCVPHTDDETTRVRLVELCEWLARSTKMAVRSHRASSPEALANAFSAGRVDIAWVSPALLITHAGLAEAKPLVASVREGTAQYHGVLFVTESSSIRSPSQLHGTRAAWVAKSSAAGYIVPRLALASHGLDPREIFASERFYDSHGNVARAVYSGLADVGATFAVFEKGDASKRLVRAGFEQAEGRARILYAAGPIPSDPIVIGAKVSMSQRIAIINAFIESSSEAAGALTHVLGASTFEMVRPRAYDALREDICNGRELGLLDE